MFSIRTKNNKSINVAVRGRFDSRRTKTFFFFLNVNENLLRRRLTSIPFSVRQVRETLECKTRFARVIITLTIIRRFRESVKLHQKTIKISLLKAYTNNTGLAQYYTRREEILSETILCELGNNGIFFIVHVINDTVETRTKPKGQLL